MQIASFITSIISALIAIGGFIFSLVKYRKHEKILDGQQKTINQYQIKKIQAEEEMSKKAKVDGNIMRDTKSSVKLRIFNSGQANARNVRIQIIGETNGLIMDEMEPIELINPLKNHDYRIMLCEGHQETIKIQFMWDDDFQNDNISEAHLQIM